MTKPEAKALADSRFWETMTPRQRAEFQLSEPLLCMPFDVFQAAVEATLGRAVHTYEFTTFWVDRLRAEFRGEVGPPEVSRDLGAIP